MWSGRNHRYTYCTSENIKITIVRTNPSYVLSFNLFYKQIIRLKRIEPKYYKLYYNYLLIRYMQLIKYIFVILGLWGGRDDAKWQRLTQRISEWIHTAHLRLSLVSRTIQSLHNLHSHYERYDDRSGICNNLLFCLHFLCIFLYKIYFLNEF